jgi:hypothetical protein
VEEKNFILFKNYDDINLNNFQLTKSSNMYSQNSQKDVISKLSSIVDKLSDLEKLFSENIICALNIKKSNEEYSDLQEVYIKYAPLILLDLADVQENSLKVLNMYMQK